MSLAATLALAACGGEDEAASTSPDTEPDSEPQESPAGDDGFGFDLSGVEVTTTSTVHSGLDASFLRLIEILEEWGAEVDNPILSQTTGVQAIAAGESDVAGTHAADELLIGTAEGAELVGIGSPKSKMDYIMVSQADIETVEDLRGAVIATSGPGGFNTLLARFTFEDAGLDPDSDVRLAQIGSSADRASALAAGSAAAAVLTMDDWFELQSQTDKLRLLARMSEVRPDFPNSIYFAERSFWEENPDLASAWACANLESNAWLVEDRDRFIDFMAEKTEAAGSAATEESLAEVFDFATEVDMWPTDPATVIDVEGIQSLADVLLEAGDLVEAVDATAVIDTSYLEEAAEMGCGA